LWGDTEPSKRTLGIRDKKILYERAGHKCEHCEKPLDFLEMQVGHKIAASKGGTATLRNCVSLCYKCNNLMGTDSWSTFLKKMGKQTGNPTKTTLKELPIAKLKFLAKKFGIKVRGRTEESLFEISTLPPSKGQYVNALAKKISTEDIAQGLKNYSRPEKQKRKRRSSNSFF
jgi:ubiquitin C-terminal hydrolase